VALAVGRVREIRRASGSGWRKRCGKMRSAPAAQAEYGMPHALAWNIGTTTRARSSSVQPTFAAAFTAIACSQVERWL
jgi:hypothetical protein